MLSEPMLEVVDVSRYYGARCAVSGLSFRIADSECVGLLGLNGAGKSTTLRMLAGILSPTRGEVRLQGHALTPSAHAMRARIGFLPDRPPVYGAMSVTDYLSFAARLRGVPSKVARGRIDVVLEACDLGAVVRDPIDSLSHGFRQRVGLAQAIVHEPPLVVLDEPSQGLDPAQRTSMRALLRRLSKQHTIVLSTHLLGEISELCDRVLLIHEGRLHAAGTQDELLERFGHARTLRVVARADAERLAIALAALEGVRKVERVREAGETELVLECDRDLRAEVSRCVLGLGDLLELSPKASGLEAVFDALRTPDHKEQGP